MASILQSAVQATDAPALARALPYVKSAAVLILSFALSLSRAIFSAVAFAGKIAAHPIVFLSPFPVLLYILAPVIIFVQLFLEITVYSPYRAILWLSDAVYPAYAFLGVACITGALLGSIGRFFILGVFHMAQPPPPHPLVEAPEEKPRSP
jgi:cellulose synthase/poly-beta-1,6-N-acetylglucosamine synthase-like glycosyltransferase